MMSRSRVKGMLLVLVLAALAWSAVSPAGPRISEPGRYEGYSAPLYHGMVTRSVYVPMRDGVRLAVDYSLPRGLPASMKIPAIICQTRYWRARAIKAMNDDTDDRFFTSYGYAMVRVDVRGTGASFGTWPYPWSADEVKDGAEIVDWIVNQPWSDGSVGTYGTSYVGATAEFLLTNQHPAVKAAVIRFSLIDSYADIAFPGGIFHDWFMDAWNRTDQALDSDDTGKLLQMMGAVSFPLRGIPGVKPVGKGLKGKKDLKAAIAAHDANGDVYEAGRTIEFRDDYSARFGARIEQISPYFHTRAIEGSGAAVYSYTGWYDGSYTAPSVYRYLNLANCKKLIIGPWPHGGRENISPWRDSARNTFDHNAELLRFFDYHLKGIDNGIMDEPPVWYYTMGEEKWHSAPSWPPASTPAVYFFGEGASLVHMEPIKNGGSDTYRVDYTAGTGNASRHNSLLNLEAVPIGYPDRAEADQKLLVYESAPLDADLEVTGHSVVRLYVSSTADDGEIFVYLEDVAPGGTVSYITEGLLRAACRKVSDDKRLYETPLGVPWHSLERADAEPLVPGEPALIAFGLQPTSVLFRRGHRIRVAIAGADKDHYALPPGPEPQITVYRDDQHPSAIELPVVTRPDND